jgi:hypothetical protein
VRFELPSKKERVPIDGEWFAWRPVYSSSHRMWIWLETVFRHEYNFEGEAGKAYRSFHYQPARREQLTGRQIVDEL